MELERYILGETAETLAIETLEECAAVSLALVEQAKRTLHVFSRDLDARLYDTAPFLEAVRQLAIRGRFTDIRILVQSTDHAIKSGHRLIELARHLNSYIHMRAVHPEFRDYNQAFLVADEHGFLQRGLADRFEGKASFYDPLEARELVRFFTKVWEMSGRDPGLQRLHI